MINNIDNKIDKYIENYSNVIFDEAKSLIQIPSVSGKTEVKQALNLALEILQKYGFVTKNYKDIIGIADIDKGQDECLGIIGHIDVGPAGDGWNYNPFNLTEDKEHYLGRGILDDKGPIILMLHAINFLKKQEINFKYKLRFLIGTSEEINNNDIETYLKNFDEPNYVIVPDGFFPICYGEKGFARFHINFENFSTEDISSIYAGESSNVIPEHATAILPIDKFDTSYNKENTNIKTEINKNSIIINAQGKASHATEPESGDNAIYHLNKFIINNSFISEKTKQVLQYINSFIENFDGKNVGIDCTDKDFGSLSIVPTILKLDNKKLSINFDCRYPTTITCEKILNAITKNSPVVCNTVLNDNKKPYLLSKNDLLVQNCANAYEYVTKEKPKFFTIPSATYAKHFKHAINFGPNTPLKEKPEWLGSLHEANEGISKEDFWTTFKIYIHTLLLLLLKE